MSKASDAAYAAAKRKIARAKASGAAILELNNQNLKAIPPEISGLSSLLNLSLGSTQVSDLTPLAALTALQTLFLWGTQVSDLAPLAALTALQNLHLMGTQVSDLTPLSALSALQTLDLGGTQVSDLTPLSALSALQTLNLGGTQVSDLTPLAALTALQTLDVMRTQVTDLRPVRTLTSLIPPAPHEGRHPFLGLRFADTSATRLDPELARLSRIEDDHIRTRDTLAYLNGLDDAAYDRLLANGAPEPDPTNGALAERIEAALSGPILADAIADITYNGERFTTTPLITATRAPDAEFHQRTEALAFHAAHLADTTDPQRGLPERVRASLTQYAAQVQRHPANPRILILLASGLRQTLDDDNPADSALDGIDRAGLRDLLREHDSLIRRYYPDTLLPPAFITDAPASALTTGLVKPLAAARDLIAAAIEAGQFAPEVSDVQEMLIRAEEGARRAYMTGTDATRPAALAALGRVAVSAAGWSMRLIGRLSAYAERHAKFAIENPGAAAKNLAGIWVLLDKLKPYAQALWTLVAPHMPWPF
jgi:hypothetical protein